MSAPRRVMPHRAARPATAPLSAGRRARIAALLLLPAFLFAGCSSPEKKDVVVAEVGPRTITLDYFERKMNSMDPAYVPENIDTQEGREQLLDVMINKEVMALKAEELGMASDGQADVQAEQIAMFRAVTRMREEVTAPAQNPTEDQLLDYYEKLPRKLTVSFMLFDQEKTAREAKGLVEGGELWRTVAERMSDGEAGPSGDYTLTMKYGTVADDLEAAVFALPVGKVSEPLDSIYGWFLIRVDDVAMDRVQPLDTIRDKVRESVVKQESQLLIKAFIDQVFEEYDFQLDEDVLQIVFDALPEDVPLNPPPPMDGLPSLQVKPVDLDRVLMSYKGQEWTVRRFSDFYDGVSAFGRPRRERRIGQLRRFLKEQALRDLMQVAAVDRGFMEDPSVQDEYKLRREQAIVTRLHSELIAGEVEVTPEEVEAYWNEHEQEYFRPERRDVLAVITTSESEALNARLDAQSGVDWKEIVARYCIESDVKQRNGLVTGQTADSPNAISQAAFTLAAEGDLSMPSEIGPDQWLLIKLHRVYPPEQPTFEDMKIEVGYRVKAIKEEELFQQKVGEWREALTIKTYPDRLMKAVYAPVSPVQEIPVRVGGGA